MLPYGVLRLAFAASLVSAPALAKSPGWTGFQGSDSRAMSIWGSYPIHSNDPHALDRLRRRVIPSARLRVRAVRGTFVGHVGALQGAGLLALSPDSTCAWTGPVDLLEWDDITSIEVRRRSPLRVCGVLGAAGGLLGVVGGMVAAHAEGGDELLAGFALGLAGVLAGGTAGFAFGCAVPIWEPLYHAP